jgi:quinohemoprotein ethanol dehydrogenase
MNVLRRRVKFTVALCALPLSLLVAQRQPSGVGPSVSASREWTSVSGDLNNSRFSSLTQINLQTVKDLNGAWVSQKFEDGVTSRATPVVKDGMLFITAGTRVYALDGKTGKTVWNYDTAPPGAPRDSAGTGSQMYVAMAMGRGVPNAQGVAVADEKVFVGLTNGRLLALGEHTGELEWSHQIGDDPPKPGQSISAAPAYFDGVIYVGLGNGDYHVRGQLVAIDAKTGKELWHFFTVPGPGEFGNDTWPKDDEVYKVGGGGVWQIAGVDPDLGMVFIVVGNPTPAYAGEVRAGTNLFTSCVVALDMKTGKLRWFNQVVHHDIWDVDIATPLILYDTQVNGKSVKALAAMRPDGYLFLYDRKNGKPLFPIEEKPVPQNTFQKTAATQPFVVGAESILPECSWWKDKLPAGFVLGCTFQPPSMPPPSRDPPNILAPRTSVRFVPMSYSPQTGYIYAVGSANLEWRHRADDPFYAFGDTGRVPGLKSFATIAAIDTRTDKVAWKKDVPFSIYMRVAPLSTAGGLMFHDWGDGNFQAYSAQNGDVVWQFQTGVGGGVGGAAISYELGGEQYVALSIGPSVLALKLNGSLGPRPAPKLPAPSLGMFTGPITDTNQIETMTLDHVSLWRTGVRYFIDQFEFNPYRARVRVGTRVTWVNNGNLVHTIMAQDGSWSTGRITPSDEGSVTFNTAGTYTYISKEQPWMYGQLIVVDDIPSDGNYTAAQAERGKGMFGANCSTCHMSDLSGNAAAPALVGDTFATHWGQGTIGDLYNRIHTTMPQTSPGTLSPQTYIDIIAFLLQSNGLPSGNNELKNDDETLKGMVNPSSSSFTAPARGR